MLSKVRNLFKKQSPAEPKTEEGNGLFLTRYFAIMAILLAIALGIGAPWSAWWLHASGDAAVERAVGAQAKGQFAIFGSGLSQDFVDYKLRLYAATRPEIIAIGSSRVMQFRGDWFSRPYLNMGGVAGNLAVLRSTINALLAESRPRVIIIGLDFWWFLPQWEQNPFQDVPPTSGSYNYGLSSLKKPWEWLFEGKISPAEFLAPVFGFFGKGFRANRFGIMAQQTNDGFGPDGSWYYTAEITGQKPPFDFQFKDTLSQVEHGIKAFYHASHGQRAPDERHVDAFAEMWCKLRSRGIQVFCFIPPLSATVYKEIRSREVDYPHFFLLDEKLAERGIEVMDFSNPASFGSDDCEFVDGFHGGEVAYARILQRMADHWPALLPYVKMDVIETVIRDWRGNTLVPDERLTSLPEVDFMHLGCKKGKFIAPPPPPELQKPASAKKNVKRKKR